jgi:Secretion system C-terminal sorting domain/Cytochrome c554 and c-prime
MDSSEEKGMRAIGTILAALVLIGGTLFIRSMSSDATISIEGVSPQMAHDQGLPSPSTGLKVVGVGDLIYLSASGASGASSVLYNWAIPVAPVGSVITLDSTQTQWFTFRPDLEGNYTVEVTITTDSGVATARQDIVAASYVGIGTMGGATADMASGQCASCHAGQAAKFMLTNHASKLTREMDGLGSSYYGERCISCHTVGFNDDAEAVNGGFDDVMTDVGWTFPDTLQDGNWQNLVDNFPELAQLANIQCENCHGPGSLHKGVKNNIDLTISAETCAKCHAEEPYHVRPLQWETSAHANGSSLAYAGSRTPCNGCHSGYGFISRMDPASNLDQVTGGVITCATCHDPHDASGKHQLRPAALENVELSNGDVISFGEVGKLCMNCHKSRRNAEEYVKGSVSKYFGPHGSPQADMLAGTNAITFGRVLPNSTHMDVVEEACVTCHMQDPPGKGEPNYNEVGGHSFQVHANDIDYTTVCQSCHGANVQSFEDILARKDDDGDGTIEAATAEIDGLLEEVAMFLPPLGEPTFDISDPVNRAWYDDKPWAKKVLYNYRFVEEDRSSGVHNYQFAAALLKLSKEVAEFGVLTEGTIVSITDVPNDQGKAVNVTWSRFGGDGASDAPLEVYYVWRNDGTASGKADATYSSFEAVPLNAESESTVFFEGALWTQVGIQPAAQMEYYNDIVPTLYDSTSAGVSLSEFKVTGHTAVSTIFVASESSTGYSIDNLAPAPPAAIVATVSAGGIQLRWEESADSDFSYFALYRGTTSGFIPDEPYATMASTEYLDTEVDTQATYFYRLAAYDFSGNQGEYGPEAQASMATAVAVGDEIPTDYNLFQNYPNPFNPSTQIEYAMPKAGNVRIVIYDISGKEIMKLVDEYVSAGRYVVRWSANNLATGVYFYRMDAGSFTRTQTMLLIK